MFERETKREKILEGRQREMKLKEKQEAERSARKEPQASEGIYKMLYLNIHLIQSFISSRPFCYQ